MYSTSAESRPSGSAKNSHSRSNREEARGTGCRRAGRPAKVGGQGVLEHQQGLHERGAARVAVGAHRLHHPVERGLLMGEGVQHRGADLPQEAVERQRPR
ncbi:hypothetical protein, partial [Streptomyces sp. SM8]|uniref:hypothetical protein n=1 Tax=Streptomyces sp. SM8 TaxID=1195457 RepID=UPI002D77A834